MILELELYSYTLSSDTQRSTLDQSMHHTYTEMDQIMSSCRTEADWDGVRTESGDCKAANVVLLCIWSFTLFTAANKQAVARNAEGLL